VVDVVGALVVDVVGAVVVVGVVVLGLVGSFGGETGNVVGGAVADDCEEPLPWALP
jgi:hypothetical protein